MPRNKIIQFAVFNAVLTAAYVALIAFLMTNAEGWFGPENDSIAPVAFLLTFIISAAITGSLVFGRPIIWYLNGLKKEAIRLLSYTIGFLILITFVIFLVILA